MSFSTQITSDLEEIFSQYPAVTVTHNYGEALTESLKAFFDAPYESNNPFDAGFENAKTRLTLQTADMTNITDASTFTISETTYYVSEIYEDSKGVTAIAISESSVR